MVWHNQQCRTVNNLLLVSHLVPFGPPRLDKQLGMSVPIFSLTPRRCVAESAVRTEKYHTPDSKTDCILPCVGKNRAGERISFAMWVNICCPPTLCFLMCCLDGLCFLLRLSWSLLGLQLVH